MSSRRGYTLFEMLLVLALLAAVAALAWPAAQRAVGTQRLQQAAEDARVQLFRARLNAIDTSLTWQVLYEPGGQTFLVAPYETTGQAAGPATGQSPMPQSAMPQPAAGRLPEGIVFRPSETAPLDAAPPRLAPETLAGLETGFSLSQVMWGAPILFYADGSADEALLEIADEKSRFVEIRIRGLTGAVSIGPVRQEERR